MPPLHPHQVQEVLQHALHRPGHLREQQPLHHAVGVPRDKDSSGTLHTALPPRPTHPGQSGCPPLLGTARWPQAPRPPPCSPGRSPVVEFEEAPSRHDEGVGRVDQRELLRVAEDLWLHLQSGQRAQRARGPRRVEALAVGAGALALLLVSRVALGKAGATGSRVCSAPTCQPLESLLTQPGPGRCSPGSD